MRDLLLGIDLGTTNAKAAVYDLQGQLVAEAATSYPTYYPRAGWAEQHPTDWTQALLNALQQVMTALGQRAADVAGIGLSAHGPGIVLTDTNGVPVIETSPTWQDERSSPQGQQLLQKLGYLWSGMGPPPHNFLPKLLWAQEHYPAAKQARYALNVKDYVALWLTGVLATEPSSGPGAAEWEAEVIAACNWSLDRLPPVYLPTQVIGVVRLELAKQLGIRDDLPVVIGLNDGASATLSMGATRLGDAAITLSTNGVLRVLLGSQLPADIRLNHGLFNWPYLSPLWIAGGQTKAGASTLDWFGKMVAGSAKSTNADQFDNLLAEAADVPRGSHGVIFLPYLMGRGSPHGNPLATGTFTGLTAAITRGDMVRSVLEGTAFALREIAEDFEAMEHPARHIRLSGGGGRSPLWRQIIADTLAQPLSYYNSDSTLGAAVVTAVGLGLHSDLSAAALAMAHPTGQTLPSADSSLMNDFYSAFCRLRDVLFPI